MFNLFKKIKVDFQVEEVFLIHNDGTLISHKSNDNESEMDNDVLNGMITVIQDFVKEGLGNDISPTFSPTSKPYSVARIANEWQLQQLKLEGYNILIERGKLVYIVTVYSGTASWNLYFKVKGILKKVESKYSDILTDWGGNMNKVSKVGDLIDPLLEYNKLKNK